MSTKQILPSFCEFIYSQPGFISLAGVFSPSSYKNQNKQKPKRRLATPAFLNTLPLHYSKRHVHLPTVNNLSRCYAMRVFIEFTLKFYKVRQNLLF